MQQVAAEVFNEYAEALAVDPVPTKMLTAAILVSLGDGVSQVTEAKGEGFRYDIQRGLSFAVFGAVYTGAFQHWWFLTLNEAVTVPPDADNAQLWMVASIKTILCQFGTIPLVYIPLFFLLTGALRGLSPEQSFKRASELYEPLLKRNISYWIPVQMGQFLFVDPQWQVPYVCIAGFVWSIVLSSLAGPMQAAGKTHEPRAEVHSTPGPASLHEQHESEAGRADNVSLEAPNELESTASRC